MGIPEIDNRNRILIHLKLQFFKFGILSQFILELETGKEHQGIPGFPV